MKTRLVWCAVLLGAMALSGVGAVRAVADSGMEPSDAATGAAIDQALTRTAARLDLAQVAPFAWTRVYFFQGYESPSLDFEHAGIHWDDAADADLALASEGRQMIVFVRGRKVVRWVDYSTGRARVGCLYRAAGWARNEARFHGSGRWHCLEV